MEELGLKEEELYNNSGKNKLRLCCNFVTKSSNLCEKITQLSPSNNILPSTDSSSSVNSRYELDYKLKPDTFDGEVPLCEFL